MGTRVIRHKGVMRNHFDLVFYQKEEHKCDGQKYLIDQCRWQAICNDDLVVGPTVSDVASVVTALQTLKSDRPRVAAFGGARILAATVIGAYIANQHSTPSFPNVWKSCWLKKNVFTSGKRNFVRGTKEIQVEVVPASLLAVQAAIAKTWIVNDYAEESTFWGSHRCLVPSKVHLVVPFLIKSFREKERALKNGLAIVCAVLVESEVYGGKKQTRQQVKELHRATKNRVRLDEVIQGNEAALRKCHSAKWSDEFLLDCCRFALRSRHAENELGPAMPALALSQAISRVAAKNEERVPGSAVIAHLLPHMLAFGNKRSGHGVESGGCAVTCSILQDDWPEFLQTPSYDEEIVQRAAEQTLSIKARVTSEDHRAVLERARP